MKQARAMVIGMAAATLALILALAVRLILVRIVLGFMPSSVYFEWSFLFSFLYSWVLLLAFYLVGGVVIESVGWIARKYGIRARPNYIVFGVLLVVTSWLCGEFSALIPRFLGHYTYLTVAVLLACIVTLTIGLRQWRGGGGKEWTR